MHIGRGLRESFGHFHIPCRLDVICGQVFHLNSTFYIPSTCSKIECNIYFTKDIQNVTKIVLHTWHQVSLSCESCTATYSPSRNPIKHLDITIKHLHKTCCILYDIHRKPIHISKHQLISEEVCRKCCTLCEVYRNHVKYSNINKYPSNYIG